MILSVIVPIILLSYLLYKAKLRFASTMALFLFPAFSLNAFITIPTIALNFPKDIDVVWISVVILWFVVRARRRWTCKKKLDQGYLLAFLFAGWMIIEFLLGIYRGLPYNIVPSGIRVAIYFALGYFIWVDIFSRFSRNEVWVFFFTLIVPTVYLSGLYILSGMGMSIYPYVPYSVQYIGEQVIIRDFTTAPRFLFLSITSILLLRNIKFKWLVSLGILIIAAFFLYTRVLTLQFILIVLFSIIYQLWRSGVKTKLVIKYIGIFILFVSVLMVLVSLFPVQVEYFSSRIQEVMNRGIEADNAAFRVKLIEMAYESLNREGYLITGYGLSNYTDLDLGAMGLPLGDSAIAYILFYFGVVGIGIIGIQMIVALFDSFLIMRKQHPDRSRLGAYLFITVLCFVVTFFSVSYLSEGVLGSIPLALIYVEKNNYWSNNNKGIFVI